MNSYELTTLQSVDYIPGKEKNEITLICGGLEIIMDNAKLVRTMDTGADAFSTVIPWEPGKDYKLDQATQHNSFSDCEIYIGGDLVMAGTLYGVKQTRAKEGSTKALSIFTQIADIIDSTMIPPFEARNISLVERCKQLCGPFGIPVVVGNGVDLTTTKKFYKKKLYVKDFTDALFASEDPPDQLNQDNQDTFLRWKWVQAGTYKDIKKFPRVVAKRTDKIFEHLRKLAAQEGILLSCTRYGELLLTMANLNSKSIGTIDEDTSLSEIYEANYDGRKRFAIYQAIGSSARHARSNAVQSAKDEAITKPRVFAFRSPHTLPAGAKNAAEWMKNKAAADSMTFKFPVNSWYGPDDKIWTPNTIVTVASDILEAPTGFDFLITSVEYKYENKGTLAILNLKPPYAYTIGELSEP
jgi:prophage tail gpP-like protein